MMSESGTLLSLLKRYFGFESFRPRQEEIIRDALAERDVFALLPTGGGKSLCFQLPALIREGLTVVVSPLIALMKDQVDALTAMGVPATYLNSSLDPRESQARLRDLESGKYRLLYVAPERLMTVSFLAALERWNVTMFAVDEAHCISEWGHDFRPEYRQLAALRERFPRVPVMALTATATERVRGDVVSHLQLRDPGLYVASFNRPNLSYRIIGKRNPYEQVLSFLRERSQESGIVYCWSRKGAESLAERLSEDGIQARPYHAGLERDERTRNQDMFLRDDVRVICATIAFGMGVNKPNIRYVIHYDMPKHIEGYYQETGRAGRDGLPSECLMLFSAGDAIRYERFMDEKEDPHQREIARAQLQEMVAYAESGECRRRGLLRYFGEEMPEGSCDSCDNCLADEGAVDATMETHLLLACVRDIRKTSGFSTGLSHVVEVICGANTEKVRRWQHEKIASYGTGAARGRDEWTAIGRELIRLGYLRRNGERFNVIELTARGEAALQERTPISIAMPDVPTSQSSAKAGALPCDEPLFERLRQLRKKLADEQSVPGFVIFSDVALRQMARAYPTSDTEFARISGVGDKKLSEFGAVFMSEIKDYLRTNSRQAFAQEDATQRTVASPRLGDSPRDTLRRFRSGESAMQITQDRGFALGTIMEHLALAAQVGETVDLDRFIPAGAEAEIEAAFAEIGLANLTGVRERLAGPVRLWGAQAVPGGAAALG